MFLSIHYSGLIPNLLDVSATYWKARGGIVSSLTKGVEATSIDTSRNNIGKE